MQASKQIGIAALALVILSGCGASAPAKKKVDPSRPAEATFKGTTAGQVRTRLMVICTQDKFQIHSTQPDLICLKNVDSTLRERLIEQTIDSEFASNIRDGMKFVLTQNDGDVTVVATSITQFTMLGGFTTGAEVKNRDLVDDASFTLITEALRRADGTN